MCRRITPVEAADKILKLVKSSFNFEDRIAIYKELNSRTYGLQPHPKEEEPNTDQMTLDQMIEETEDANI